MKASRLLSALRLWARRSHSPVNYRSRDPSLIDQDVEYALTNARSNLAFVTNHCGKGGIVGTTVVEIGPGINFAQQLALAGEGVKAIVADRFLAPWDPSYHPEFYRRFLTVWGRRNAALESVIAAGGYPRGVITLVEEPTESLRSIPDQSVDIAISNAVMEHVFDLERAIIEFARITKPGGRHSHQVDFRDHRDFDRPLEFLLMEDQEFAILFKQTSGETGNRRRACDMAGVFEQNGFVIEQMQVTETAKPEYLTRFIPRLRASNSRFRDLGEEELSRLSARFEIRRAASR